MTAKKKKKSRQQSSRDRVFPPVDKTARDMAAMIASGEPPADDWRPMLSRRFGIDANLSPHALDGIDPGEPDRYDIADIHEAHALVHVPLWRIDASQAKLLLDYRFDCSSIFCLALLMAEANPFLFVEGSVYGELLPSVVEAAGRNNRLDLADALLEKAERAVAVRTENLDGTTDNLLATSEYEQLKEDRALLLKAKSLRDQQR